jgi:hypothetical protein
MRRPLLGLLLGLLVAAGCGNPDRATQAASSTGAASSTAPPASSSPTTATTRSTTASNTTAAPTTSGATTGPSEPAAITVTRPSAGARLPPTFAVSGSASVFEATVSLSVTDASGAELVRTFATATEGAPGQGTFEATVAVPNITADTPVSLEVFEASAKDGSHLHSVVLPLVLTVR